MTWSSTSSLIAWFQVPTSFWFEHLVQNPSNMLMPYSLCLLPQNQNQIINYTYNSDQFWTSVHNAVSLGMPGQIQRSAVHAALGQLGQVKGPQCIGMLRKYQNAGIRKAWAHMGLKSLSLMLNADAARIEGRKVKGGCWLLSSIFRFK